jgi:hypothetical protein
MHKSRPFEVMFNRQCNDFIDYRNIEKLVINSTHINAQAVRKKMEEIGNIIIPTVKQQIIQTQSADNKYFMTNAYGLYRY